NSARATVEAHAGSRCLRDRLGVDVVDDRHVHVVDSGVVVEPARAPVAADITDTEVAKPIVDAAVEAYVRTPVAGVPHVRAAAPTPVARGPQRTDEGRDHPIARHPVVVVGSVSPVARYPDVTRPWAYRLNIDRNRRRGDRNRHEYCALRS